jgi:hypothetical protein
MNTTGLALKINDELTLRSGDVFENPKGGRLYIDGFTKTNRIRFTFISHLERTRPATYTRTPDAFLGHVQREQWTQLSDA